MRWWSVERNKKRSAQKLVQAAREGNAEEVHRLIPLCGSIDSEALRVSAIKGHTKCVELLIPVSNCPAVYSEALRNAASINNTRCVALLAPVSDCTANNSEALQWACHHSNEDMLDILYPLSDPQTALGVLNGVNIGSMSTAGVLLSERIKSEQEKQEIENNISGGFHRVKRKI